MEKFIFKDTVVSNPNRKKLTIVSQTANEIVADISYSEAVQEQGTVLSAEMLNRFQDTIEENEAKSIAATSTATSAAQLATQASNTAIAAKEQSETAVTTASNAKAIAEAAQEQVVQMQGTKVYEGGLLKDTFNADLKVDVEQSHENANKVLVTDADGNISPSNEVPFGNGVFISSSKDETTGEVSLVITFPEA